MGLSYAELVLKNPRDSSLAPIKVRALVDTGAMYLCLPDHVVLQLRLEKLEDREVTLADGNKRLVDYVGPVEVHFERRGCFVGALAIGDEVLLGVVPMEDMDLVICPRSQAVTANPESPNIPSAKLK